MRIPTVYELDEDGHATGVVYHFCRLTHRTAFVHEGWPSLPIAEGYDTAAELSDNAMCSYCGQPFPDDLPPVTTP
jgi:hypothetical protein